MVMAGNKSDVTFDMSAKKVVFQLRSILLDKASYIELGFEVTYTSTIPYDARYHDLMSGPTSPRSRGVSGLRWHYLGRLSSSHLARGSHGPRLYKRRRGQEAVTAICRPSVRSHSSGEFSSRRRRSPDEIYEGLP
ncbi:unnamed protein product [Spirodela intermedia]|uniref:Uncharacterized protein n=1 Tax=Spirodela intermedia TaxID=51605 RepID=A0A7I8KF94_SPIIN|nr:unnamed protein product [Spirodela intermedia]